MKSIRSAPIRSGQRGLTLIELIIALVILGILAAAVVPMAQLGATRNKEIELRRSLREVRSAIDAWKADFDKAVQEKKIIPSINDTGYPESLEELVEGNDWSGLYLHQELGMPQSQAGVGFAVFSLAMALSRFAGDALRARHPERRLLAAGASLAAVAMGVALLVRHPVVALVGYLFVGAGLALVVPILYNAATRVPGVSRAAAIASVSSVGYAGFLVGPPVIGFVAHVSSLSLAMGLVVVAAVALALGARRVA